MIKTTFKINVIEEPKMASPPRAKAASPKNRFSPKQTYSPKRENLPKINPPQPVVSAPPTLK